MTDQNELEKQKREGVPSAENAEPERILQNLSAEMRNVFPGEYETIDRTSWDAYDITKDEDDDGAWLKFHSGEVGPEAPRIAFVRKKDGGILVHAQNNPRHDPEKKISQMGGSLYYRQYQGDGPHWPAGQARDMTEATRMWLEGIDLTADVLDQPAFLMGENNAVATMRTIIQGAQDFKEANKKKGKARLRGIELEERMKEFQPGNMYEAHDKNPEVIRELVLSRLDYQIKRNMPFRLGAKDFNPADLISEIKNDTVLGQSIVKSEVMRLSVQHDLLWQASLINHSFAPHIDLPPAASDANEPAV